MDKCGRRLAGIGLTELGFWRKPVPPAPADTAEPQDKVRSGGASFGRLGTSKSATGASNGEGGWPIPAPQPWATPLADLGSGMHECSLRSPGCSARRFTLSSCARCPTRSGVFGHFRRFGQRAFSDSTRHGHACRPSGLQD